MGQLEVPTFSYEKKKKKNIILGKFIHLFEMTFCVLVQSEHDTLALSVDLD